MPSNNTGSRVRELAIRFPGRLAHLISPGGWRTPFLDYALDNGAFKAFARGTPFDEDAFDNLRNRARNHAGKTGATPLWMAVPDVVANRERTIENWHRLAPALRSYGWPLAFVVQDGMQDEDVRRALRVGEFRVLFIGGSLEWKLANVPRWVALGHAAGVQVHVGRMGTCRRARYARECGADSVDSCTPLWSKDHLRRFLEGLRGAPTRQPDLFGPRSPPAVARAWKKAV